MKIADKSEKTIQGITLLQPCPTADLVAIIKENTQLFVFHTKFQKINSYTFTETISSLVWRPDGKFICLATENNHILFFSLEDNSIYHQYTFPKNITRLYWTALSKTKTISKDISFEIEQTPDEEVAILVEKTNAMVNTPFNALCVTTNDSLELMGFGIFSFLHIQNLNNIQNVFISDHILNVISQVEDIYELSTYNLAYPSKLKLISEKWMNFEYLHQKFVKSIDIIVDETSKMRNFDSIKTEILTLVTRGTLDNENVGFLIAEQTIKDILQQYIKKAKYVEEIFFSYTIPLLENIIILLSNLETLYKLEKLSMDSLLKQSDHFGSLVGKIRLVLTYVKKKHTNFVTLLEYLLKEKTSTTYSKLIEYFKQKNQDDMISDLKNGYKDPNRAIQIKSIPLNKYQLSNDEYMLSTFSSKEDGYYLAFLRMGDLLYYEFDQIGNEVKNDALYSELDNVRSISLFHNNMITMLVDDQYKALPFLSENEEFSLQVPNDTMDIKLTEKGVLALFNDRKLYIYLVDED